MDKMHIVGYYDSEAEAIPIIEDLKRQGYSSNKISIISKNSGDENHIANETGTHVAEGVATGAVTGGILGGLGGVLAGLGALAIPGIGPIIAAGPIAAGITGTAIGAGVGGLAGALIGMGISEEEAQLYSEHFNDGKILVLIDSDRSTDLPNRPII